MALLRSLLCLSLFCVLPLAAALAATYEEGLRAYDAGRTKEALAVWRGLAEQGDPQAKYGIGKIYDTGGQGVPRNHAEAARWYEEAARAGVVAASNNLALLYAEGLGVPQDRARAVELWKRAAEQGHREAQYNYALSLYRGSGVARDPTAAAKWFRYAAEQGLPEAQFAVGEMYLIGIGLPKDPALALAWYRRAEAQGHSAAAAQARQLAQAGVSPKEPERMPALGMTAASGGSETAAASGAPTPLLPAEAPSEASAATPAPEVLVTAKGGTPAATVEAPPAELAPEAKPEPAIKAREASQPAEAPAAKVAETTPEAAPAPKAAAGAAGETSSLAPPPGAWALWLLSAGSEAEAKAEAEKIMRRYSSLADLPLKVQQAKAGNRNYYRALAGSLQDLEEARRLCRTLRGEDPDAFCSPMEQQ